jgi:hypothetical protein
VISAIPPYNNQGCKAIGIVPTDIAQGIPNNIPADFNPRPKTDPTPVAAPAAAPEPATPANAVPAAPGAMAPAKSN